MAYKDVYNFSKEVCNIRETISNRLYSLRGELECCRFKKAIYERQVEIISSLEQEYIDLYEEIPSCFASTTPSPSDVKISDEDYDKLDYVKKKINHIESNIAAWKSISVNIDSIKGEEVGG